MDSHPPADAHAQPAETAEEREDRARSAAVQAAIARRFGRPLGLVLAIGGAGISLALLGTLARSAAPLAWTWLLLSLLLAAVGVALLAKEAPQASEDAPH